MVTYGDGVSDINIKDLLKFHRSHGKIATLTGVRPKLLRYGQLEIEQEKVVKFIEKPKNKTSYINGGFYIHSILWWA